jgi:type VI secretion system secreted protein VgrG
VPKIMDITTPLGEETLLFYRMQAWEELGRLSSFHVDLLSKDGGIVLDDLLGKSVTVNLETQKGKFRYFNGYVTRFEQGGMLGRYHHYKAVVHPWFWFLTRTADCRIFQEMTVPDILKKVFQDHGVANFKFSLTATYRKWDYCVQYRETDFNFISRLMEHEGIYYYFTHAAGQHTMVITDAYSGHAPVADYETVPYLAEKKLTQEHTEHIESWEFGREVQPGVFVHDDYDMERPSVELRVQKSVPRQHANSSGEMYDWPGEYVKKPEGEQYAAVRIEEHSAMFQRSRARSTARGLATGCLFTLDGCPRKDQNCEHLIVSASHVLEYSQYEAMAQAAAVSYDMTFTAMPSGEPFRPQRQTPKPIVQGPQTAVVVGPGGEEIYTDKYGRVKVQFHWDRRGKKDQNSSCWIRVSQPWAGKTWGGVAIPRIGQEVVVDFLEGDPDQPLITGRVYNAEQMPPYELPANMTQTGIKSRSSMGGGPDNFNEIRFEDKKGSEQVFIHAEKNQDIEVENDETHWVGHDRKKTIDNDETTHVKRDRTEKVGNNEKISIGASRTEDVAKDETITIGGGRTESVGGNETISIDGNRNEGVSGNESISVDGNQSVSIDGDKTLTVGKKESINVGDSRRDSVAKNEEVTIGKSRTISVGENDTLKVTKNVLIDAGDSITIKTGSASITMKKDGTITIKGKDITLNGSGKINVKASSDVVIKGSKVTQN